LQENIPNIAEHTSRAFELENSLQSVERIIKVAEINNNLKAFRVFGVVAQSGLTASILTTALSFYSVIFSMYGSTDAGQNEASAVAL
jgi:hypothetical protein